jgi:hypothetical protein
MAEDIPREVLLGTSKRNASMGSRKSAAGFQVWLSYSTKRIVEGKVALSGSDLKKLRVDRYSVLGNLNIRPLPANCLVGIGLGAIRD